MTARHVPEALSGEGADEVFGGYQPYLADRYASRARRTPAALRRAALGFVKRIPVSDEKIGLEYKLKRFLAGTLLPADEAHFYWNGTFSEGELRKFRGSSQSSRVQDLVDRLPDVPAKDVTNRYLYVDQNYYLPDDILYKCDRMSMAHSLEVRPPFLDHRIVEFASRLPIRLKIAGRTTKRVLRDVMETRLPAAILNRPKEGLDIPAHDWLRGPLRPLVLETLNERAVREAGALPWAAVSSVIERHMSRAENLGYHLWGLLTVHLWIKRWRVESHHRGFEKEPILAAAAGD
jgi:asparagine synthase (glutamine-hydrolysing)